MLMKGIVLIMTKYISDDELYCQYIKLIYYVIHHWSKKPKDYGQFVEDIAQSVLFRLFSLPKHGSRRTNKSFINTVIQTTISAEFNKLRECAYEESIGLTDEFQKHVEKGSN